MTGAVVVKVLFAAWGARSVTGNSNTQANRAAGRYFAATVAVEVSPT